MSGFFIDAEDFDLELTMTCGQTFCWNRLEGDLYGEGGDRFYSFRRGEPVIVEQRGDRLFVETELSRGEVREALGLDHNLAQIFSGFPEDPQMRTALENFWGLRVVQDEFFPCLVSYLCSPQMRIPRIKKMHDSMAKKWGERIEYDGRALHRFPTPEQLGDATEQELRNLGVGYRAEYIVETTKMVRRGDVEPEVIRSMSYGEARQELKRLHGVGDKVADCVLLFSLGFLEAAPLDTWAKKALRAHYPRLHSEKYDEASENLRGYFGENAGYAQEYIFHAARKGVLDV